MNPTIEQLLHSAEPCIRYRVWTGVMGLDPASEPVCALQEEIRRCERVRRLLSERQSDGTIPYHPYQKWRGAHWVLACLADLGYPAGDENLIPLREQVLAWLLSPIHLKKVKTLEGRTRRCASQEGNALHAMLRLGLADERADELAHRLVAWQWPDGGWNCDKKPAASHSSFMESLIPLRALTLYARLTGDRSSQASADRAAELFLEHRLFRRSRDGGVIHDEFLRLHYPSYWHYDILSGLKVMAEIGRISDDRCREALDYLESRRLPSGGFPADEKYYRVTPQKISQSSPVEWGRVSRIHANGFVSAEAYAVLQAAGRLSRNRGDGSDHPAQGAITTSLAHG